MMRYGLEGYGLYFYCLEMVARTVEKHNLTFELEHDAEIIAFRVGKSIDVVQDMMTYMADLGLFENDRGVITCLKMATRADEYTQKLLKQPQTKNVRRVSRQTPDTAEIKSELIEENRIEEKRIDKKKRFIPPTMEEVTLHAKEKKLTIDAEDFIDFYDSKGWMVGKNKMQNWKSAATRWARKSTSTEQKGLHNAI